LSVNKTEAEKAEDRVASYGLKETLKVMLMSKYWRIMIGGQLLIYTAMQLLVAGAAYFALYVLGDMNATSWMLATQMLPSMIILFIAPALMKRFGKVKLFTVGILLLAVGCVGFGLMIHSKVLMIVFCTVKGIGFGLNSGMTYGIIADMISHTRQETGIFAAGVGNAGTTAVNKLGQGVGNIILGFTMSLAGFNGALKVQPAAVTQAVTAGFVWIPATIFIALFIVFVLFFDLDKVMKG
jgi:GPH family glycoside/pentoside/hexuronide:cation symporter